MMFAGARAGLFAMSDDAQGQPSDFGRKASSVVRVNVPIDPARIALLGGDTIIIGLGEPRGRLAHLPRSP